MEDAKSGLIEIIPLIGTSAIWGQYPVLLIRSLLRVNCWEWLHRLTAR